MWKKATNKFEVKLQYKAIKLVKEINPDLKTEFDRKSKLGHKSEVTIYECESYADCQYKSKCTKPVGNRKMQVSKLFVEKRNNSLTNITLSEGLLLRMNRSIQVEGAFSVMKEDYGFRHFLTRGKNNVKIDLTLLSFGYSISKLHNKIQDNRCGLCLYLKKIT